MNAREEVMLQVYLDPCTVNCRKLLAGLDLLGTPFEVCAVHSTIS
jgi:hypothetical protein